MQTTFPLKLEIVSLELSDISDEDFLCSISLLKGMQNFGQIRFQIDKEQLIYTFNDLNIIKFFYAPRLTTRRDVFFKIILTELQSGDQMGQLPISTHLLAETFQNDKAAIIECRNEIMEGVYLTYKIYQPQFQLQSNQIKYGFEAAKKNDFISNLFARPEAPKVNMTASITKPIQNVIQKPIDVSVQSQKKSQKKRKPEPLPALNILTQIFKKPQQKESSKDEQINLQKGMMKISHAKHSIKEGGGEDLIAKLLGHIRQSKYREIQKKYTLSASAHHNNHGSHGMSKKLKMVIFLLIFGLFMVFADMFQDAFSPTKEIKKSKKNLKKKLKANHH